jgi:AraC-like DNA-binding protein
MDLRIEKVVALMKDDLTQRLPLGKMAQSVNLSPARLCYLFKSEIGMSAARYLKSLRMTKATVLLSTTFLSVKEVMARVGLADESHFVKDFKRIYGLSPTEYRKTKANGENVPVMTTVNTGPMVSASQAVANDPEHFDRRATGRKSEAIKNRYPPNSSTRLDHKIGQ